MTVDRESTLSTPGCRLRVDTGNDHRAPPYAGPPACAPLSSPPRSCSRAAPPIRVSRAPSRR
ncbi:hypothetical protein DB32_007966 [Sandaracinus amylolyticus]|uniref:Uncharacterized protein n=1 Tax=Sandaracinus amylolyticus TaxID=927083 RepID=A0A0F6W9H5_9BACT|nr:hypothetical protein DB32_007966 [Sandaracinus amylolyticus]